MDDGDPTNPTTHLALGFARLAHGDAQGALDAFDAACRLQPALGEAHAARGYALDALGHAESALAAHAQALALGWLDTHLMLSIGVLQVQFGRFQNAHAAFAEAARLDPPNWRAHEGLAMTLAALRRYEEAVPVFETLIKLAPAIKNLRGQLFHARLQCADWTHYDVTAADIAEAIRRGEHADTPWTFLCHNSSPADQLRCAQLYAQDECAVLAPVRRTPRPAPKIRIAYLSADFHEHATAYLSAGLFERHDRRRFETSAVSFGPRETSRMRTRLERAFDRFVDVAGLTDQAIASAIEQHGIDIAIDMKGFTTGGRPRILAYRPAPVQVAFLAFPGTLGCPFIDYVVADRHVIPERDFAHYTEKIIWMPHSYQVNDAARPSARAPSRRVLGLSDNAFVFCCFNAHFKINPVIFDVWMRLLGKVGHSVLWLLEGSGAAQRNLRREAAERGVDPERLLFAPLAPAAEHWARIAAADLVLDTLPYNAHTTASDALWAGVPLVTIAGSSFAGRVGASLLAAAGLSELCVESLTDYEALALRLASRPEELAGLRSRLAAARDRVRTPLFDTEAYCRDFETALARIHERQQRGEAPSALDVAAL
jgi:predicted O-linked N-acetylglucosamine transferase (SPINDLY family)